MKHLDPHQALQQFERLLRKAHASEVGASAAYRGHWKSEADPVLRNRLKQIEHEEREHLETVKAMLLKLGHTAHPLRTLLLHGIGTTIAMSCFVTGRLIPMLGAALLEDPNIRDYELAARYAWLAGHGECVDELLRLAEVEWDHEDWLRQQVRQHAIGKFIPLPDKPAPRAQIRLTFFEFTTGYGHFDGRTPWDGLNLLT